MRVNGYNILAIVLAAAIIYAVEFVIFAVLIPGPAYQSMVGLSDAQMAAGGAARMPYGVIMPILEAIGLAVAIKWRGAVGLVPGAMTGIILGILFSFSATMYQFVYGAANEMFLGVSVLHFAVAFAAAGALIAAWK